ncbi:MAG: hypothetical protein HY720_09625 [Planctomycetes bacterium]|nr:hypothetical protein [Planctomycetota bacterium]
MPLKATCPNCGLVSQHDDSSPGPTAPCSRCSFPVRIATQAAEARIRFLCPSCGEKIGVPRGMAERAGSCPACKASVTVPEPSEDAVVPIFAPGESSELIPATPARLSMEDPKRNRRLLLIGVSIGAMACLALCCGGVFVLGLGVLHSPRDGEARLPEQAGPTIDELEVEKERILAAMDGAAEDVVTQNIVAVICDCYLQDDEVRGDLILHDHELDLIEYRDRLVRFRAMCRASEALKARNKKEASESKQRQPLSRPVGWEK